jgi:hypothetical protein
MKCFNYIIIFSYACCLIAPVILNIEDFFVFSSSGTGPGDLNQGSGPSFPGGNSSGDPGGSPGLPHNSQDLSGQTTSNQTTENSTNCSYMYTIGNELLGTCGRGGSGPYDSSTITTFSNKFISVMDDTGQGNQ